MRAKDLVVGESYRHKEHPKYCWAKVVEVLKQGKRLTHKYFTATEWIEQYGVGYIFEDGCRCTKREFWQYRTDEAFNQGWSEVLCK